MEWYQTSIASQNHSSHRFFVLQRKGISITAPRASVLQPLYASSGLYLRQLSRRVTSTCWSSKLGTAADRSSTLTFSSQRYVLAVGTFSKRLKEVMNHFHCTGISCKCDDWNHRLLSLATTVSSSSNSLPEYRTATGCFRPAWGQAHHCSRQSRSGWKVSELWKQKWKKVSAAKQRMPQKVNKGH